LRTGYFGRMDPARASIREHFLAPTRPARPDGPDGTGSAENAACGDTLQVFLRVRGPEVRALDYWAQGCRALVATASLVCEHAPGLTLEQARSLDVAALVSRAGGLPPTKAHAPRMVQRALREALADHLSRCHP